MVKVRNAIAEYIGADGQDLVFVSNASAGVNSVLRSLKVPKDKCCLYLNIAYPMVTNCLKYLNV